MSQTRAWTTYGLLIAGTIGAYLLVRHGGEGLVAPPPPAPVAAAVAAPKAEVLPHVLLALLVVVLVARAVGMLFRRLAQPAVVGEMLAGILLGPSLLGRVAPNLYTTLLPAQVAPHLGVISQVGIILYMFLVGLELDPAQLRRQSHAALAISHASIVVPFLLGAAFALVLYPRLSTSDVPFTSYSLFLGVAMAVTAFPVLARILAESPLAKTPLGTLALTCAAVDDVTAWCLLSFVVSVARAEATGVVWVVAFTLAFVALMLVVVRPLARRFSDRIEGRPITRPELTVVFVALLASALATEAIGIHAVFGAFFLGAVVPPHGAVAREMTSRLEDVIVVFLLPAFFAYTGLRTQIGLVDTGEAWVLCVVVVLLASAGKFGGSWAAARLAGLPPRDATALGILLNTRGLMELVVLNIGLDLHILSPTVFAMMVVMALVTTLATTPVLQLVERARARQALAVAPGR